MSSVAKDGSYNGQGIVDEKTKAITLYPLAFW